MTHKTENPSAFPSIEFERIAEISVGKTYGGMTLRDYFAAKALQGILNGDENVLMKLCHEEDSPGTSVAARICYEFADAMLKERTK